MTVLFDDAAAAFRAEQAPLADRMRPRTLDDFVGQEHILGEGKLLRRAIEADRVGSVIFYGPPGTGKTTLARIIAGNTESYFSALNAVLSGVKDIRAAIEAAANRLALYHMRTILFVDEVHRFNKAQQDALLPHVENGTVVLIGATTENPYFEVIKPLVSRSRVFEFKSLDEAALRDIIHRTLNDERGYVNKNVRLDADALAHLVSTANGDARSVLNALELAVETTRLGKDRTIHIDLATAEDSIQRRAVLYDREGDAHFDTISAFIKSMRGSDPDAALYWLSRMVYAGEDPRFILRRMLIFAAEDVGLADPRALLVASGAATAFEYVGMPEGQFLLSECCLYLATAPKSNSTMAYFDAKRHVEREETADVPLPLKDASRDSESLGHGKGYRYPHAFRDHYVAERYLPPGMEGTYFYSPGEIGYEAIIRERMARRAERDEEEGIERRVRRYVEPGGDS